MTIYALALIPFFAYVALLTYLTFTYDPEGTPDD